jgi:hypothetical protein
MRTPHLIVASLAGFVSLAQAQNFNLWLEPGEVSPDGVFTVTVYGDSDLGGVYIGGGMGLEVSSLSGEDRVSDISWDFDLEGTYIEIDEDGYLGGGSYGEVSYYWLMGCGIFPCEFTDLGEAIGHFTIEVDPDVFETYEIDLIAGPDLNEPFPYTIEAADPLGNLYNDLQGSLTLTGTTVSVVPAPGLVSMMMMYGVLSSRRLRRKGS